MSYRNIPSSQPHRRPCSSQGPPSYTTTTPAVESPLHLSPNPGLSQNHLSIPARDPSGFADPNTSTGPVPSIAGDFANLNTVPRGGVRGARSFSSPSPAIGLNTGPTGSPFLSPGVYPAGQQSSQSRGQLAASDPRYSTARSVAVGSEDLSGNMAHEAHNWVWQGRPSHPHLQQPPIGFDQPYSPQQSVSPGGFPIDYDARQGTPRNYYQSSPYLSVPSHGLPQGAHHPRSVSMSYAYPSSSVTGTLPSISPSYFVHQPEYYLPETSLPSHAPSIPTSPQPQHPGAGPSPYYTSPSPAPTASASASASASTDQDRQVRVISFRPKPQCWEHGCNGREFSTFSNLLRHQREKSGVVAKAECPVCGAAFTRTTARNIHLAQGKCKGRE
ncbi:hypothetical protein SI65_09599 [Aspergillus cristatus]|uniref:C2H2-type domain-containing protein n=1 Tax=Aspergillus cristatus TaxID=573508 RepID=A0A1E3B2D6_ASPCR|nr:hypothetical protein SI65_09599 [Aspergillus cristatus]